MLCRKSEIYSVKNGEILNDLKAGSELARLTNLDSGRSLPGCKCWVFPTSSVEETLGKLFNISVKLISFLICKLRKIPHMVTLRMKFIEWKYFKCSGVFLAYSKFYVRFCYYNNCYYFSFESLNIHFVNPFHMPSTVILKA